MLFQGRVDRAAELQKQINRERYNKEENEAEEITTADVMEKGDMTALILSACLTLLPVCALALFAVVSAGLLFFHIF